ncbi:MAG TPA: hypothetical protein ENO24_05765, partial [Chloroflexi bacterium]|nr:hypothetical protein [Chloroflexota bacterium]
MVLRRVCLLVVVALVSVLAGCGYMAGPSSDAGPENGDTPTPQVPSSFATATPTPSPVPSATPTGTPTPLTPLAVSLSWRFSTLETVWSVRSDDLDGDGAQELLAASYDKRIYVLSAEG